MENITPLRPIPVLASRPARWLASLVLLAVPLAMTVPIYAGWLSGGAGRDFRFALALLWGVLALAAAAGARTKPYVPLVLGLFGISLGFAFAYLAGNSSLSGLGGRWSTPKGAAFDKILTEVIPVSAAIFLSARLSQRRLESLGLRGGKAWQSLGLGLLATLPLVALFAIDPSGGRDAVLRTPVARSAPGFPGSCCSPRQTVSWRSSGSAACGSEASSRCSASPQRSTSPAWPLPSCMSSSICLTSRPSPSSHPPGCSWDTPTR